MVITHPAYEIPEVDDFNEYEVEVLGPEINTVSKDEFGALVSSDGKSLYYVVENAEWQSHESEQDIWIAASDEKGKWKKGKKAPRPLNNEASNYVEAVQNDNNQLILGNTYTANGGPGHGSGVSRTRRTATGWEVPVEIEIENFHTIGDKTGYSFSADGKTMFICTQLSDNRGGLDIYISHLQDDGTWTSPANLSGQINTPADEISAYFAADNRTLYFSSTGRPGYGKDDLYVSKRLGSGWNSWSLPLNLGPHH